MSGTPTPLRRGIENQARRVLEDCDYSSRRHFEDADSHERLHYQLGGLASILSAIAIAALLADVGPSRVIGLVAAGAALVVIAVLTANNPGRLAVQHQTAGNEFLALRKEAQLFCDADLNRTDLTDAQLEETVRRMADRMRTLNRTAGLLITSGAAWKRAKRNVQAGESTYQVDQPRAPGT